MLSLSINGLTAESQKVSYGLRISRLSKDLYELLNELDLKNVAVLGHWIEIDDVNLVLP